MKNNLDISNYRVHFVEFSKKLNSSYPVSRRDSGSVWEHRAVTPDVIVGVRIDPVDRVDEPWMLVTRMVGNHVQNQLQTFVNLNGYYKFEFSITN